MRENHPAEFTYCERLADPGFWAEPLHAVSNFAFIIAAIVCWARLESRTLPIVRLLVLWLFGIGVGSGLLHTVATPWAGFLDVLFIALFVVTYFYAANRYFLSIGANLSLTLIPALFAYIALATWGLANLIPMLGFSSVYATVAILIAVYGVLLMRRHPAVARGLMIGAVLLTVSITFRTIDKTLCETFPYGTHFVWHILNAVMLAWMIEVLKAHVLDEGGFNHGDE
ncbi:MAG: hypothetical protein OXC91_10195 [Rhodobacteraceae bacterium]|nr:hypothetical protein [Paracoccaceae bacterium]